MRTRLTSHAAAVATVLGSATFVAPLALGAGQALAGCAPSYESYWKAGTVSYRTIGSTAGAQGPGTLSYSRKTEVSTSTSVSADADFSIDAGIAQVSASLSVSVTKTFAKGQTVTHSIRVPSGKYGKIQPKAQITVFTKYLRETTSLCDVITKKKGTLTGITVVPSFAVCISTPTCKPTP